MRIALIILMLPVFCFSQITISDDFSDGDFSQNPSWSGDTGKFVVNPAFQLQLNDNAAGSSYLSTPSQIIDDATWEFYTRMEFNPSSSNYCKVYLVSDNPVLSNSLNGYYVKLGGSSSDRISLFRQNGNSSILVVESSDDWLDLSLAEVSIKVTRDSLGFWVLSADTSGAKNYVALDSALDATYNSSQFFGIECKYTVTRSDKFFFDDIALSGRAFVDNESAKVDSLSILGSSRLSLKFSENVDSASAIDVGNYLVSGTVGLPINAFLDSLDHNQVELVFAMPFAANVNYDLFVNGVEDLFGNVTNDTVSFRRFQAVAGQIVITELMVDPTPVVGVPPNALPEREYIEICNNSSLSIDLFGWVLQLGSTSKRLPQIVLDSGEYVVLTKDDGVAEFPINIPVVGLDISSTALTNGGSTVSLISPLGVLVNTVSYADDWYTDNNKSNGGWSLELIDKDNVCAGKENWKASESLIGGTPGKINSVAGFVEDTVAPFATHLTIISDSSITVFFNEKMDQSWLGDSGNFGVYPKIKIESTTPQFPAYNSVTIQFEEKIKDEILYNLHFKNLATDCSGNNLMGDSLIFAIPAIPKEGDVLINEVLFNPYPESVDFVELYNNSNKVFDLSKLNLGNWNSLSKMGENLEPISFEGYLFVPNSYICVSSNPEALKNHYHIKDASALYKSEALPSMSDSEGSVAMVSSDLSVVCDYFEYSDDMHLSILEGDEGVSLERISFAKSTQHNDNWHSAAAKSGFATPGYVNSMAYVQVSNGKITLDPKVFSPNQDGYHDILQVNYSFEQGGNVVSLSIWNGSGAMIRELQNNTTVGQEGFFTWDGTDDNGQLNNSGVYIVVLEYFNSNGRRGVFKETCVLSL